MIFAATELAARGQEVYEFHGSVTRQGVYIVPGLTLARAKNVKLVSTFDGRIRGDVYAQPLAFISPRDNRGRLLVVTEENIVYALDADSGKISWEKSVGQPVSRSVLPCGNIDPVGITGTPVIDPRRGAAYFDALVLGENNIPQHLLFAVSLADGSILSGFPINMAQALRRIGITFEPRYQNQRGALAIVGDTLFVPFGGNYGDCGPYHGLVVAVSLDDPTKISAWMTRGEGGGIWAPGGVVSDNESIFVVTGNTKFALKWADGEAVIKLAASLENPIPMLDFFVPSNWRLLDLLDLDLGGTNPVLVDLQTHNALYRFIVALGKDGKAYLLDRRRLGGEGGGLVVKKVASGSIRTAPAVYMERPSAALIIFQGRGIGCPNRVTTPGLEALRIEVNSSPTISVAWCATLDGEGAPIVTTSDGHSDAIVWVTGAEGDNCLHAFAAATGDPLVSCGDGRDAMNGLRHFSTIIAAYRKLFVAADNRIYAFSP